jgi:hypothetical protein
MIIIFTPVNLEPKIVTKHELEENKTECSNDPSWNLAPINEFEIFELSV